MDTFTFWQNVNFSLMFMSYGMLFLCRKCFSYLLPAIIAEENFSRSQLGIISSSLNLAYCLSKFICGVLSDKMKPHLLLTSGLIVVGILTVLFANSYSVAAFVVIWFLNGLGQGCGWPPCTKLLKQWYLPSQLGTWWSLLSASSNLSGAAGPLVLTLAAHHLGWRSVMTLTGCSCVMLSFFSYTFIKNSPSDVGSPPILKDTDSEDAGRGDANGIAAGNGKQGSNGSNQTNGEKTMNGTKINGIKQSNGSRGSNIEHSNNNVHSRSTMQDVLRSPFLWLISLIFFCCNLQAGAFQEWAQLLLIQDRGFSTALGSGFTSAYNVGGTIGCIASGYITDRMVAMCPKRKTGSHRLKYLLLIVLVSICLQFYLLKLTTPQTPQYFILICAFVLGFCVYGNVSLNGVLVIENSPAYLSGSAHAIAALAGNVGSVTAGFPLSFVSSMYDWSMTFLIVLTCSVVKLGLLLTASRIDLTIGRHSKTKAD